MPIETSGIDAIIKSLKAKEAGAEDAVKAAVKAGGKLVAERLKEAAPVDSGALKASIKPGAVKQNTGSGYYCEVMPVGNHPKTGEPLAKVGNVLEYGRSYGKTKKPGIGWFFPTVKQAQGDALQTMTDTFKSEMERKK